MGNCFGKTKEQEVEPPFQVIHYWKKKAKISIINKKDEIKQKFTKNRKNNWEETSSIDLKDFEGDRDWLLTAIEDESQEDLSITTANRSTYNCLSMATGAGDSSQVSTPAWKSRSTSDLVPRPRPRVGSIYYEQRVNASSASAQEDDKESLIVLDDYEYEAY